MGSAAPKIVCLVLIAAGAGGCGDEDSSPASPLSAASPAPQVTSQPTTVADGPPPTYVTTQTCVTCHEAQQRAWSGSHHDLAMQEPSAQSVLGAFDGSELSQGEETFRFIETEAGYVVEVRGPAAEAKRYPVRYTFGAVPLQQYLVDVGDGRLQALLAAWDARPKDEGGQRWFHLQADDYAPPGDPLHWQAPVYTWNSSCAACHSTGVDKGYDRDHGRFDTTFSDVDVGCESCHGPGSVHVQTAAAGSPQSMPFALTKAQSRRWVRAQGERIAKLQGATTQDSELERCAPCHSRRAELGAAGGPFHDAYRLALLERGLYFADGQIDDEVFVYGSFVQSKMHTQGVVCSDCHDPHTGQPRARGNALCTACHGQEVFDTPAHHLHPANSEGAQCVACHMPQRIYMQVDARADHRFGVPDPLLAAAAKSPDPCLGCHEGWTAQRAAAAIEQGRDAKPTPTPTPRFGRALLAARTGAPDAPSALIEVLSDELQPPIVRATALQELGAFPSRALAQQTQRAAADPHPLLRRVAAQLASSFPSPLREQVAVPLLADPTRSVRLEATAALFGSTDPLPDEAAKLFQQGLREYAQVHAAGADRAQSLVSLATLAGFSGNSEEAQTLLEAAVKAEPVLAAAHVNLADVHRAAGREAEAEQTLRAALKSVADPGPIRHALGLTLIRSKRTDEALRELEAAHRSRPDIARYGFVYAVALFDAGQQQTAFSVLQRVHDRHRGDVEVLSALGDYAAQLGKAAEAQRYRRALQALTAAAG